MHLLKKESRVQQEAVSRFKLCCIQSCDGSRGLVYYTTLVILPFCILYYWQLMYVLCFIPSKSKTIIMVTCGYSISVLDTYYVVGYPTAPRGVYRIFQRGFPKRGYACDMLCMRLCMVRASPVHLSQ